MKQIYQNSNWEYGGVKRVTVITPVYNRKNLLKRAIQSIENQVYRDFEYIIVDDGSQENMDDLVFEFMNTTDIPVLYIKKENGGVHTARNEGCRHARGELMVNLDGDDELVDVALQIFVDTWSNIPDTEKNRYREVVAQCMDETGKRVGNPFPDNINNMSWKRAKRLCRKTRGEHIGFDVAQIRKENLWPEPEGVNEISGDLIWEYLNKRYRSYFINDMLRIYHTEVENSMSKGKYRKKTLQDCINKRWESSYFLNHWKDYDYGIYRWIWHMVRYGIMNSVLRKKQGSSYTDIRLSGFLSNTVYIILKIPCSILALIYMKRKM